MRRLKPRRSQSRLEKKNQKDQQKKQEEQHKQQQKQHKQQQKQQAVKVVPKTLQTATKTANAATEARGPRRFFVFSLASSRGISVSPEFLRYRLCNGETINCKIVINIFGGQQRAKIGFSTVGDLKAPAATKATT